LNSQKAPYMDFFHKKILYTNLSDQPGELNREKSTKIESKLCKNNVNTRTIVLAAFHQGPAPTRVIFENLISLKIISFSGITIAISA